MGKKSYTTRPRYEHGHLQGTESVRKLEEKQEPKERIILCEMGVNEEEDDLLHPVPSTPDSLPDETGDLPHRPPLRSHLPISGAATGRRLRFFVAAAANPLLARFVLRGCGSFRLGSVVTAIGNPVPALPLLLLLRVRALPSAPEQPVLVRVDDLVDRLAVRRRVPARPEALVAPEAAALEHRGVVPLAGKFVLPVLAAVAPDSPAARSVVGARDEVGQDFPVAGR